MVWSAINGASEKLKGNCEGTLSQSLVLNMCAHQCAQTPPINICSLGFITQWYYKSVLRVFSPNFLERKAQVTVTIRVRQSALYILQLSIGGRFCRIKSASETISESLKFWGGHAPRPPYLARFARVGAKSNWNGFRGAYFKTPFTATRLSIVVYRRVSGYNIFRARYIIIH